MFAQHLHGSFHKVGRVHILKALPVGALSTTALTEQRHVVGVVRTRHAEGLVKGIVFKVGRKIPFDESRHICGFHATPTVIHDTLFQMSVVHLALYLLTVAADFACHADSDFVRFQKGCDFGDKGSEFQSSADIVFRLAELDCQ